MTVAPDILDPMNILGIKFGDIVKPATKKDAYAIGDTFPGFNKIPLQRRMDYRYKVLIVVGKGEPHRGAESGVIVSRLDPRFANNQTGEIGYPYVWNFERFVKA